MELWIILIIVAQFLNALVVVVDKYIVTTPELPRPSVYAFYVALLSAAASVIMLPISFTSLGDTFGDVLRPHSFEIGLKIFGFSILAGLCYVFGIILLFNALKRADASDVVPVVGASSALVTFFVGMFVFDFRQRNILSLRMPAEPWLQYSSDRDNNSQQNFHR